MKPSVTNIPSLTPLRGIAASLVALFHFQVYYVRFINPADSMFLDKGYLMVDLFFIMSGFLIMHVYKDSFRERVSLTAFRQFVVSRFARIYPLHIITLAMMVAFFYLKRLQAAGFYDPSAIASHVFLLHSFPLNREVTWNIPSWSISAEWWSYMFFPALSIFLFKRRKTAVITMSALVIILYIAVVFFLPRHDLYEPSADLKNDLDVTSDYGFLRSISGFMLGMLLYLLYCKEGVKKIFNSWLLALLTVLLIIYGMHKDLQDLFFIPVFCVLVLSMTCTGGKLTAFLNNKALTYLGDISYSVYMIHFLLIQVIEMVVYSLGDHSRHKLQLSFCEGLAACTAYFMVLLIISAFSYKFIEKPCRKYITGKWAGK